MMINDPIKLLCAAACLALVGCAQQSAQDSTDKSTGGGAIPVTVVEKDGRYTLLRGGQAYEIKGAGIDNKDLERFAMHGGTSFRNWGVANIEEGLQLLDQAAKHGLTVAMCISIGRERHGFDYDDKGAVSEQLEWAREQVLAFKDHPALLLWIIGNEPDLFHTNPKVFDAINEISRMIHQVDGNHPTTTALSGFDRKIVDLIRTRAPDLDIISLQKYADIVNVPKYIREAGLDKPYLVTEWGPIGHWEGKIHNTSWGAPVEKNSSKKAAQYQEHYQKVMASHADQIIGSYVFFWGQKQERTPTWYGMFLVDGSKTEAVDVMHHVWNGTWPQNRSPQIEHLLLDKKPPERDVVLKAGSEYPVVISATDPDSDALEYRWDIMYESQATQVGGDPEEIPGLLSGLIDVGGNGHARLTTPGKAGAYRLFVYVYDGQGHAGHANFPFLVE